MDKEEKLQKIKSIHDEQKQYVRKSIAVAKLPEAKRAITSIKRAQKVVGYVLHIRSLEMQKQMIIATPVNVGFVGGGMIVAEPQEREVVVDKNGKIFNFIHPITFKPMTEAPKQAWNLCNVSNSALEFELKDLKETLKQLKLKRPD